MDALDACCFWGGGLGWGPSTPVGGGGARRAGPGGAAFGACCVGGGGLGGGLFGGPFVGPWTFLRDLLLFALCAGCPGGRCMSGM
jgi:hypothetical protein